MTMVAGPQNYYVGKGIVSCLTSAPNIDFWKPSTAYALGDTVLNFDASAVAPALPLNVYQCTTAGTSGTTTGPHGTGTALTDGAGSAVWESVAFADIGNCSEFTTEIKDTREKHFTSRSGAVTADFTYLTKRECDMSVKVEEMAIENLSLFNYGVISGTAPNRLVKLGQALPANYAWQFVGTGAYGKHFQVIVPRAQLMPGKIDWIGEKMVTFDVKADVLAMPSDNYSFCYGAEIA